MRIVLASLAALPESIGGGEVHAFQLARALIHLGHTPSMLTVEATGSDSVMVRSSHLEGIPIHYLKMPACTSPYDREQRLTEWATRWFRDQQTDVLHLFLFSQLSGLIPAANKLGVPVCLTALEFGYFCRRYDLMYQGRDRCSLDSKGSVCEECILSGFSPRQRFAAAVARILPVKAENLLRSLVKKSVGDRLVSLGQRNVTNLIEEQRRNITHELAAVITPSTLMRDFYLAQGVSFSKLHLIPYGSDIQAPRSNGNHLRSGPVRIGYIGRMDPKKGLHLLCEAVQTLPRQLPVELHVFGPLGNERGSYSETIRSLAGADERIKLRGKLDRTQMTQAYEDIDVLVVPSIWYENSPITISEALNAGCPVVCSDTAGMLDLIQHGKNGLTFPVGDKRILAHSLKRLVEDPALLMNLRRQVRPVETSEQVARQLIKVYEQVRSESISTSRQ